MRASYFERERERATVALRYGNGHPEIQSLDTEINRLRGQIAAEVEALAKGARAELKVARELEAGMRTAQAQANAAGLELSVQEITHRRLQRERDNASRLYGTILERSAETDLARALDVQFVRVLDRALKPTFSVEPRLRNNLVAGSVLGFVLGIGLAFLMSMLDRTLRSAEDVEALGITVLGILPRIAGGAPPSGGRYGRNKKRRGRDAEPVDNADLIVHTHPKSAVAECCRTVRTNITFMSADRPQRALVVTSPSPREGKTTVTLSLAISLSQSGKRVLVVDTDLRRPRIHKALGAPQGRGVTTILVGEHSVAEAVQQTEVPGLDVLTSGPIPPNPSELLHTSQFGELIGELTSRYDCVLFDSPPLQAVTDAAVIAPQVDGTIVVVHGQRTTRDALSASLRQLRDVGAALTGCVVNSVDLAAHRYGYQYGNYYYYHQGGYYGTDEKRDAPAAEA
jgi:capsular exopolysaccharide synthesis family protein